MATLRHSLPVRRRALCPAPGPHALMWRCPAALTPGPAGAELGRCRRGRADAGVSGAADCGRDNGRRAPSPVTTCLNQSSSDCRLAPEPGRLLVAGTGRLLPCAAAEPGRLAAEPGLLAAEPGLLAAAGDSGRRLFVRADAEPARLAAEPGRLCGAGRAELGRGRRSISCADWRVQGHGIERAAALEAAAAGARGRQRYVRNVDPRHVARHGPRVQKLAAAGACQTWLR